MNVRTKQMFVPDGPYQLSLMFAGKAKADVIL